MTAKDIVREKIISLIKKSKEIWINELAREAGLNPGTISLHIKELEGKRIVISEIKGNMKFVRMNQ